MPKGTDKSWVEKLYDKCKKWEHFEKPRLSQTSFIVRHFADNVEYQVCMSDRPRLIQALKLLAFIALDNNKCRSPGSCTRTATR